jgi:hypothetical protein
MYTTVPGRLLQAGGGPPSLGPVESGAMESLPPLLLVVLPSPAPLLLLLVLPSSPPLLVPLPVSGVDPESMSGGCPGEFELLEHA